MIASAKTISSVWRPNEQVPVRESRQPDLLWLRPDRVTHVDVAMQKVARDSSSPRASAGPRFFGRSNHGTTSRAWRTTLFAPRRDWAISISAAGLAPCPTDSQVEPSGSRAHSLRSLTLASVNEND